jgi:hypothetical protein
MTFPAELTFKRDRTLSPTARRVYDFLTTVLDFTEVRPVKAQINCEHVGTNRGSFGRALDQLVGRGYLVEHARELHGVRRFTLAWSINADEHRAG